MAAHVIRKRRQAGFSLVEVLITGAILTVGLLGLMLLQTMAIRTNQSGQNVATCVRLGTKILDAVAAEGRMRKAQAQYGNSVAATSWTGGYYTVAPAGGVTETYDKDGSLTTVAADAVYTAVVTRVDPGNLPAAVAGMGLDKYQVVISYKEVVSANAGAVVNRTMTLERVVGI